MILVHPRSDCQQVGGVKRAGRDVLDLPASPQRRPAQSLQGHWKEGVPACWQALVALDDDDDTAVHGKDSGLSGTVCLESIPCTDVSSSSFRFSDVYCSTGTFTLLLYLHYKNMGMGSTGHPDC